MTDLQEIAYDALRQMYREAEPSADFDEILENAEEQPNDWYTDYYLDGDRQREIVEEHCDKHDLDQSERTSVTWTAITHYGPTSVPPEEQTNG